MNLYRDEEILKIIADGAIFILKIDGQREAQNIFTVMLSGGKIPHDEFFRKDGSDITKLVDDALTNYFSYR